ncbi:MAG TPA: GWxTD domain-containing protein, partial [Gemmatimonadales bacterium]|nr:GWxTD domain-containing protein [Gemmatimonadales bacterium]
AGAQAATSATALAQYRQDVSYLADSAELKEFDAQSAPAARAAWLRRFWNRRDVVEGREMGERLAEHNRRWFYAERNFRLVSRHRHYDITEVYRSGQAEFDDRGVIYLRHGPPDERAMYPSDLGAVEPNQSWLYRRPGGDLVFHFVARDDAADYKLVESLVDALGFRAAVAAAGHPDAKVVDLYASREQFGGSYARVARGGSLAGTALTDERSAGRRAITTGTTTDTYAQRFPVSLNMVVQDFVAGAGAAAPAADGAPAATTGQALHVVFAIPAGRLGPEPGGEGVLYPLHFRLLVSDLHDSLVARLDTLRVFTARQVLRAPSFLSGRLSLPLPPGHYRFRLLVATNDQLAGQLVMRDSVEVPALDGRAFATSDVVVGRAGAGLVWLPPRDTVLLDPLGRYPTGSVAELYYEIYGLGPGESYHTEVRLEREGGRSLFGRIGGLFGGRRPPVLLAFDSPADGPVTRVHRGVSLRGVSPGNYRLSITLSIPSSGRRVSRSEPLLVVSGP